MNKAMMPTACAVAAMFFPVKAEFAIDRSAMSEKYWSVWNDEVQAKIDADIEKYRKTDAAFEVTAPDGAEVKVEQVSHAFYFGAHIFNFNQLGKKEWNDRHKELYGTLFNSATVAFYWKGLEPRPGEVRFEGRREDAEEFWNACDNPQSQPHWRRPAVDPVVDFLKARGVHIHGHPLVWGNHEWHVPQWLWDEFCPECEKSALAQATGIAIPVAKAWHKSAAQFAGAWTEAWYSVYDRLSEEKIAALAPSFARVLEDFTSRRIRDIAARYGDVVDSWDVVNESASDFTNRYRRRDQRGDGARNGLPITKSHFGPMPGDYAWKALDVASRCLPASARLCLNDYDADSMPAQVAALRAERARIDAIGVQMHLKSLKESEAVSRGEFSPEAYSKTHPDAVRKTMAALSATGLPIHLSEVTITASENSPKGEMTQAVIMRNLYRLWFSIGGLYGITWWNVVDGCGAAGEPSLSGLFTRDMKPKAAYFAMDDLVNREWKTETTVNAAGGKVAFRGFRGRYRLTWKDADGKEVSKLVDVR